MTSFITCDLNGHSLPFALTVARSPLAIGALLLIVMLSMPASVQAQIWPNANNAEAARARAAELLEREAASSPKAPHAANPSRASAPLLPPVQPAASAVTSPPSASAARLAQGQLPSQITPREFALTLGDTFTQRIALPYGTQALSNPSLELRAGRVGTWFQRQRARREVDAQGRDWLLIDHQIINVPTANRWVVVPSFSLSVLPAERLHVAPAAVSIGPLTPVDEVNAERVLAALHPDRAPVVPSVEHALRRVRWVLAALGAVLLAWLGWLRWRDVMDARNRPFAHALHAVKRTAQQGAPDESAAAWVAMHHAFNSAAGCSVHTASLSALFTRQPHLHVERETIERFFAASNARFFKEVTPPERFDLLGLAQRLRQHERQTS